MERNRKVVYGKLKVLLLFLPLLFTAAFAQKGAEPFRGHLYNDEYKVALHINLYEQDIIIPGQELFGQMAGYLVKDGTTYCWLIVSADIKDSHASLTLSNDYGSEDLTAELTAQGDTLFVLKQVSGSQMKVPNNGKWQKLPKTMQLKRRKKN